MFKCPVFVNTATHRGWRRIKGSMKHQVSNVYTQSKGQVCIYICILYIYYICTYNIYIYIHMYMPMTTPLNPQVSMAKSPPVWSKICWCILDWLISVFDVKITIFRLSLSYPHDNPMKFQPLHGEMPISRDQYLYRKDMNIHKSHQIWCEDQGPTWYPPAIKHGNGRSTIDI